MISSNKGDFIMNEQDFNQIRNELNTRVDYSNFSLDNLGISSDDFKADFKEQLVNTIQRKASERLSELN